jgi:Zn-dependent oligopeptidase
MDFRPFLGDAALVASTTSRALDEAARALRDDVRDVRTLDTTMMRLFNAVMPVQFLRLVAVDESVRAAASKAMEDLDRFELALYGNTTVYAALVQDSSSNDPTKVLTKTLPCVVDPHPKVAALERYIRDFEVKGAAHLAEEERARVQSINSEIAALEAEFQRNIANDATQVAFKKEELAGLDESFLGALKRDATTGDLLVTLQYPHVQPVLRWATSRAARERMWRANASKVRTKIVRPPPYN